MAYMAQGPSPRQIEMLNSCQTVASSSAMMPARGFSLIEMTIALLVLTFGLLTAAQLMSTALNSSSLARSKGTAAIAAQDKLEYLADLYRRNSSATDLAAGNHGPQQVEVVNPADGSTLNLYNVSWSVGNVPDPRPGKILAARLLTVTVVPIRSDGTTNNRTPLNKVVSVTAIVSPRMQ